MSIDIHISLNGVDQTSCGSQNEKCRSISYALWNSTITHTTSLDSTYSIYLDPGENSQFVYKSDEIIHICSNLHIFSSHFTTSNVKPVLKNVKILFCLNNNQTNSTDKFLTKAFSIDSVDLYDVSITTHWKVSSIISNATIINNETFYKIITYPEAAGNVTFINCRITVVNKIIGANSVCEELRGCTNNSTTYIVIQNTTIYNGHFEMYTSNSLDVIDSLFIGVSGMDIFSLRTRTKLRILRSNFIANNVSQIVRHAGAEKSEVAILDSYFSDNIVRYAAFSK